MTDFSQTLHIFNRKHAKTKELVERYADIFTNGDAKLAVTELNSDRE
jgi:hypothetical protein